MQNENFQTSELPDPAAQVQPLTRLQRLAVQHQLTTKFRKIIARIEDKIAAMKTSPLIPVNVDDSFSLIEKFDRHLSEDFRHVKTSARIPPAHEPAASPAQLVGRTFADRTV